eukprot:31231-Pelagococcus_subviridis.AAC.7
MRTLMGFCPCVRCDCDCGCGCGREDVCGCEAVGAGVGIDGDESSAIAAANARRSARDAFKGDSSRVNRGGDDDARAALDGVGPRASGDGDGDGNPPIPPIASRAGEGIPLSDAYRRSARAIASSVARANAGPTPSTPHAAPPQCCRVSSPTLTSASTATDVSPICSRTT